VGTLRTFDWLGFKDKVLSFSNLAIYKPLANLYPKGYNKIMEIEIELYETASGHCPFDDWFESLRELHTRAKILTRLDRLKMGNFGDCKALGDGIAELRIHYGPGIRVY